MNGNTQQFLRVVCIGQEPEKQQENRIRLLCMRSISGPLCGGLQRSGFEPSRDPFLVFLGKTLYSHSTSLYPGYKWVPTNQTLDRNPAMKEHSIWGK